MKPSMMRILTVTLLVAACNGSDYSPTAPPPPVLPPGPSTTTVAGSYVIYLANDDTEYPTEVQVLLDGAVIYTGPLITYDFYYTVDSPYISGALGSPSTGRHTLGLMILATNHGRETFMVSGRVEVSLSVNQRVVETQGASWDESVRIGVGEAWTGVFEIREWQG